MANVLDFPWPLQKWRTAATRTTTLGREIQQIQLSWEGTRSIASLNSGLTDPSADIIAYHMLSIWSTWQPVILIWPYLKGDADGTVDRGSNWKVVAARATEEARQFSQQEFKLRGSDGRWSRGRQHVHIQRNATKPQTIQGQPGPLAEGRPIHQPDLQRKSLYLTLYWI